MQTSYFTDGCLRGVQTLIETLPNVVATEAGRVNGAAGSLKGSYDGHAEASRRRSTRAA